MNTEHEEEEEGKFPDLDKMEIVIPADSLSDYILISKNHPAALAYIERRRQVQEEGFTFEEYDKYYENNELESASIAYLSTPFVAYAGNWWPQKWNPDMFKPTPDDRGRELIKAIALAIAAYERWKLIK